MFWHRDCEDLWLKGVLNWAQDQNSEVIIHSDDTKYYEMGHLEISAVKLQTDGMMAAKAKQWDFVLKLVLSICVWCWSL